MKRRFEYIFTSKEILKVSDAPEYERYKRYKRNCYNYDLHLKLKFHSSYP